MKPNLQLNESVQIEPHYSIIKTKTILSQFEVKEFEEFDNYFHDTFKIIYPLAKRIIYDNVNKQKELYKLISYAISDKSPSDYPFIFRFSYQQNGNLFKKIQKIAAAVHLLQISTLVIDDIFDKSNKRGNHKTLNKAFGTNNAFIIGELLQTISLNVINTEIKNKSFHNDIYVIGLFNEIIRDVYVGQYLDIFQSRKTNISVNSYYKMISLTTGKFLSNISKAGALLANSPKLDVESLSKFGYFYGMALQICDDIIDITDNSSITEKTFACDIKHRRLRLPLILALKLSNNEENDHLMQFITNENKLSYKNIRKIIKIIKGCGSIDNCKLIAEQYIYSSLEAISSFEDKLAKNMLRLLALSLLRDIGVVK